MVCAFVAGGVEGVAEDKPDRDLDGLLLIHLAQKLEPLANPARLIPPGKEASTLSLSASKPVKENQAYPIESVRCARGSCAEIRCTTRMALSLRARLH